MSISKAKTWLLFIILTLTTAFFSGCSLDFIQKTFAGETNLSPRASFFVDPPAGSLSTTFTFDASPSVDSRGLKDQMRYRFNFDISSEQFSPWQKSPKISHKYQKAGVKRVILEIKDKEGFQDHTYLLLNVREKTRFNAYLRVYPLQGNTNTVFSFFADIMSTIDLPIDLFQVRFDFDGDGNFDTGFQATKQVYHTFGDSGLKIPRVEIKAPTGETLLLVGYSTKDDSVGEIRVDSKAFPGASMEVYPRLGYTDSVFSFDAGNSYDFERSKDKLKYKFDFEDDGIFDTEYSLDSKAQHNYLTPGIKKIVVEILNQDGLTDTASTQVFVQERDFAPEVKLTVSNDSKLADRDIGTLATTFTFRPNARDDKDKINILRFRYDFESDGNFDTVFSNFGATIKHRYDSSGLKKITVECRDSTGHSTFGHANVTIIKNTPPKVVLDVDKLMGTTATVFNFKTNRSVDSQYKANNLEYRFDFDGDGKYDTAFKRASYFRYQFPNPGIKKVKVQVRDPEGMTAETVREIEILNNSTPHAVLEINPLQGNFQTAFNFNAGKSSDGQTPFNKLKFRWDFDYNGPDDVSFDTGFSSSFKRTYRFKSSGERTIRLQVMDENGEIDEATKKINLHWASPYLDYLYQKGIMRGYKNNLQEDKIISRAEMYTMILKSRKERINIKFSPRFSDVTRKDWYWQYVLKIAESGYDQGYSDNTFKPQAEIGRIDAIIALMKIFPAKEGYNQNSKNFRDVPANASYLNYLNEATILGIVEGYPDGTLRPNEKITRAEFAKMLYLTMEKTGMI